MLDITVETTHARQTLEKKALLLTTGVIFADEKVRFPFPLSRSTAGPGAGVPSVMLEFGGTRIKLGVSREKGCSDFTLTKGRVDGDYQILRNGNLFLDNVSLVPTLMHAPEQAFINIDAKCKFHCLFCSSPKLHNYKRLSNETWIRRITQAVEKKNAKAVAVTSGIPGEISDNIQDFITILNGIKHLGVPIGVEPYVENRHQLQQLFDAGATELKLNIQTWDRKIFKRVCPELSFKHILNMLEEGVKIFGRNKVTSNIIIGLGETDENILSGIRTMAKIGVAAVIRIIHLNRYNSQILKNAKLIGDMSPGRILNLRDKQNQIFLENGIEPAKFETMCFPCLGCDLDLY